MTSPPHPDDPPIAYPGFQEPPPASPVPHQAHQPPPQPYAYPPQPYVVYVQPAPRPPTTSPSAVASLVFGVAGLILVWCTFGVPALIGIILGHIGLMETRRDARPGRWMAIAGLAISYVTAVSVLLFWTLIGTGVIQ